jgi:hypothetical protein
MLSRTILAIGLTLTIAISALPAQAHHSFAATFTDEIVTVEGYVESFSFKNPHVIVYFNVTDEKGEQTEWMSEGGSATRMRSSGWSSDTLVKGDYIRITGSASRNGSPMISMTLGDTVQFVNPATGAVVGVPGETTTETVVANNSLPMVRADGLPNLTGAWAGASRNRPAGAAARDGGGMGGGGMAARGGMGDGGGRGAAGGAARQQQRADQPPFPFNEAGAALQAQYDPANDPAVQCEQPGLVRQNGKTPHPIRIEQFDSHVVISNEEYGGVRTIYFDDRDLVGGEHTHLGQSMARYEGQKLIIETTHLLANLAEGRGNALTDQTTTVETYWRSADEDGRSFLNTEMVITDPGHLTEPYTMSTKRPYTADYEFSEADCHKPLAL